MLKPASAASARRVQASLGPTFTVLEFDAGTRTAADAARAIGCTVAQIAKSILFRPVGSERPVLVIASGSHRVDEARVVALLAEPIERADPAFVRRSTGFAIGGVPPVGHAVAPLTVIDDSLFAFEEVWAAAGTPNAVFKLTPQQLLDLTGGRRAAIAVAAN